MLIQSYCATSPQRHAVLPCVGCVSAELDVVMTVCLIWGLRGNWPPGILHFEFESFTKIIWLLVWKLKKKDSLLNFSWPFEQDARLRESPALGSCWLHPPGPPHPIIFGTKASRPADLRHSLLEQSCDLMWLKKHCSGELWDTGSPSSAVCKWLWSVLCSGCWGLSPLREDRCECWASSS